MSEPTLGAHHQRVRRLRRLLQQKSTRLSESVFVAEGLKLLEEALEADAPIESIYYSDEALELARASKILERARARGHRAYRLGPGVLERVANAVTPQPLLATVRFLDVDLDRAASPASRLVVLVDVRDPGNVGTIIRSAHASGARAVVCCGGTVDPYNPKAVRASAGSLFHVPLVVNAEAESVLEGLRRLGFLALAALSSGGEDYLTMPLSKKVALFVGNEANGLSEGLVRSIGRSVSIPTEQSAESLNVAMASTVLLFELARRERLGSDGIATTT